MLYTLTMNPAVDMNISSRGIHPGLNRTAGSVYTHNGKGINVARVARHFGRESGVLGFFGGFSGRYIVDCLREEGIPVSPILVEDTTRINIFLNDGRQEYKFVGEGACVPPDAQRQLLALLETLPELDTLTINGSLPPGVEDTFYDSILEVCAKRRAEVVLDISSRRLPQLLRSSPLLIKPNDEEVREIWGRELNSPEDAAGTLDLLHSQGARNVLLTLGERGLLFSDGTGIWSCDAPKVDLVSSACAGDACLAAFLCRWQGGGGLEDALKTASATGADVAGSPGLGRLLRVPEYIRGLTVTKLR